MTEDQFCKNDSSFNGDEVDSIKQISHRSFNGEELKEYVEHHINMCETEIIKKALIDYAVYTHGEQCIEYDTELIEDYLKLKDAQTH